jgi:hypothetical protein
VGSAKGLSSKYRGGAREDLIPCMKVMAPFGELENLVPVIYRKADCLALYIVSHQSGLMLSYCDSKGQAIYEYLIVGI